MLGIQGQTLLWIKGFLCNRSQIVSVNGVNSTPCKVTSGVPQGSVLGPTLFLMYINDIVGDIKSNIRLFADDTIMYRQVVSPADHLILQQDLDRLTSWACLWQMEFNVKKCYHISLTNKRAIVMLPYYMHGQALEHVASYDCLLCSSPTQVFWRTVILRLYELFGYGTNCQLKQSKLSQSLLLSHLPCGTFRT